MCVCVGGGSSELWDKGYLDRTKKLIIKEKKWTLWTLSEFKTVAVQKALLKK